VDRRAIEDKRLDRRPRWRQIEDVIEDAYRAVAPKKLLAELDASPSR
jgi:hypothetical protein